eukprot:365399-Chlamydomonas_euryale.AAC.15
MGEVGLPCGCFCNASNAPPLPRSLPSIHTQSPCSDPKRLPPFIFPSPPRRRPCCPLFSTSQRRHPSSPSPTSIQPSNATRKLQPACPPTRPPPAFQNFPSCPPTCPLLPSNVPPPALQRAPSCPPTRPLPPSNTPLLPSNTPPPSPPPRTPLNFTPTFSVRTNEPAVGCPLLHEK